MANFTDEQLAAIQADGKTIVSASAGSGKTTVMIEKIIRLIQDGKRVDEILAVTFTKKAAAQMKEKLCKVLIENINAQDCSAEKRAMLKKQLAEVPNADISTIHSFCSKLIRSHFYAAGVDNTFRVIGGDDAEGTALKNEALNDVFEEGYAAKNNTDSEWQDDGKFAHLLSVYWRKKSDNTLRKIFLTVYEKLRNRADYREYLQNSGVYTRETFEEISAELLRMLKEKCKYYHDLLEEELYFFAGVGAKAQIALATELCDGLDEMLSATDYFGACALQKPAKYTQNRLGKDPDEECIYHKERLSFLKSKVVAIYDDELGKMLEKEQEYENFLRSGETARALATYLLRFDEKYQELKTERGVLDYNDLEHKALALLKDEKIVEEMREKYRYVFVDEYQDVNPVQEEIISRLSGDYLFLVGDVKQSIYGFRGSKSKFFVQKQAEFASGAGKNLALTRNFRSADAVLDAVNSQFSLAMTLQNSSVNYKADSYMEKGGRYALNSGKVQIHFLGTEAKTLPQERGVYSVKEKTGKKQVVESLSAKTIRHIIDQERRSMIYDADLGEYRQVQYSDIAILSRKKEGQIAKTVASLAAEGVPVTAAAAVNICEYAEVKTLIDILSLIDNAEQDVPLCSALLSMMGNMTADELAHIRLTYEKEEFFRAACKKYAEEQTDTIAEKLKNFYAYYQELRRLACVLDAGELLTKILTDTRMESGLLSHENGVSCLKRIHRFIEETASPEPLCVHDFLDRLRNLDYEIEFSENGGENSVKVLTMHSSKGLEYPVVIVDNLSALFRAADHDEVLVEETFGLAPRAYNQEKMLKSSTILRHLNALKETESSVSDELNLYYVALTRAKHTLHLLFEKRGVMANAKYAKSYEDFTDFDVWEKYIVTDDIFDLPKQERESLVFCPDESLARKIMDAVLWEYAHSGFENLPVKSSATDLITPVETAQITQEPLDVVGKQKDYEGGLFDVDGDEFSQADARDLGIAYHAFLEHFDFELLFDETGAPIEKTVLREVLQSALLDLQEKSVCDAHLLSLDKLMEILSNPVFYSLRGMRLYKERQFLVSLPVKDTYAHKEGVDERLQGAESSEEMIFQGAIDLLAEGYDENGEKIVYIIDYKYSRRGGKSILEHYQKQLNLYRLAVSKILKLPTSQIKCSIVNIYHGYQVDVAE